MSKMKQVFEALQEADNEALQAILKSKLPPLPQELYVMMCNGSPVSVYMHKDVAEHDAWLCSTDWYNYEVLTMPFFTESEGDLWQD